MSSCTLWLLSGTRVLRMVATDANPLNAQMTAGLVPFQTTEDALHRTFYPAYSAARQAGMDIAIATDGSVASVQHVPDAADQRRQLLHDYVGNTNPTLADTVAAMRALIQALVP